MKRIALLFTMVGLISMVASNRIVAQDDAAAETTYDTVQIEDMNTGEQSTLVISSEGDTTVLAAEEEAAEEAPAEEAPMPAAEPEPEVKQTFHQVIKQKFIEGGPEFMAIVLLCLIMGLALAIERIIYLNLSTTNTEKLLSEVEAAMGSGGIDAAKEVCRNTRGPVASIF